MKKLLSALSIIGLILWGCQGSSDHKVVDERYERLYSAITAEIIRLEGFREKAYKCSKDASWYTIGFGTSWRPDKTRIKKNDVVTRSEAYDLLSWHLDKYVIPACYREDWTDGEIVACASFAYNTGKAFTVGGKLDTKRMKLYIYSAGQIHQGLVKRRQREYLIAKGRISIDEIKDNQ